MKPDNFDIIVIGAGSAGLSVGLTMNALGFNVLMIARNASEIGGECLNTGCVPSKAFLHVAGILHHARKAASFGWETTGTTDLGRVMDYVRAAQATIRSREDATALQQEGITVVLGHARFTGKRCVTVDGKTFTARKIIIATGSRPQPPGVPGIQFVTPLDNETLFNLQAMPGHFLIIGGGPVGIETAQAMSRLGSRVTVVHSGGAILEHDDLAVTQLLTNRLQEEGVTLLLNAQLRGFNSAREATVSMPSGGVAVIEFDAVFIATGRLLNIESLDLEIASISVRDGRIESNAYLQTTNKHVFVCGDVAGGPKFSHVAEYHARIIVNNLLSPFKKKIRDDQLSWVTFTDPEIATFGLTESRLRQQGISFERLEQDFCNDDRAVTDDYRYGKLILFLKKTGLLQKRRILGGTMIAPHAGELIQELLLLQAQRLSPDLLFDKIYPYPTAARINQQPVVRYKQRRLTPAVKLLLRLAFHIKR